MNADLTLPPDWQWVTRVHELARGSVVCKLWWRNGVPDFRATVSKDPGGHRTGCVAIIDVAWGDVVYGKKRAGAKKIYSLKWLSAGGIEDLPYDPLAAAATVELEVHDWLQSRYLPVNWMPRWPDCQRR